MCFQSRISTLRLGHFVTVLLCSLTEMGIKLSRFGIEPSRSSLSISTYFDLTNRTLPLAGVPFLVLGYSALTPVLSAFHSLVLTHLVPLRRGQKVKSAKRCPHSRVNEGRIAERGNLKVKSAKRCEEERRSNLRIRVSSHGNGWLISALVY